MSEIEKAGGIEEHTRWNGNGKGNGNGGSDAEEAPVELFSTVVFLVRDVEEMMPRSRPFVTFTPVVISTRPIFIYAWYIHGF